jgi:adenine-specific DNA-methyltransferase
MSVFVEFKKRCMDISLEFAKHKNYVFQSNVMDFLSLGNLEKLAPAGSLVYFDPPYSTAQYSRYYHLLETVFLNDEPNVKHKGIYREDRHQSDFCSPRLVTTAFNEAISGYAQKGWNLVLSYSDSGLVKANQLLEICKTNYSKAEIHKRAFSHSTQGRGLVSKVDEIVIVCSDSKK